MVAIRKSKTKSRGKKSYNKNSKKIIHNHRLIKKLIAGVFSPKSASTKIQSISRGRSTRQSKKADDLEKLLSKGAQSYKKVLQTLDFKGISMKGQILSRRVIIGAKFKQVDFTQCKLNGTKFSSVQADGAIFRKAELKKAQIDNSSFKKAQFEDANLEGAIFKKVGFNNAQIDNSSFKKAKFDHVDLEGAIFKKTGFNNAEILISSFKKAQFEDANLESIIVRGSNFSECRFYGNSIQITNLLNIKASLFSGCDFTKSVFNKIKIGNDKYTDESLSIFKFCNLTGVKFLNINNGITKTLEVPLQISRCNLDNVTLIDSTFIFACIDKPENSNGESAIDNLHIKEQSHIKYFTNPIDLNDIVFNNLTIENIIFHSNISFNRCAFNNLNLNKDEGVVQFFKARFQRCTFMNCEFGKFIGHSSQYIECIFTKCNLSGSNLQSCILMKSTFINCNMDNVKFINSDLNGVKFTGGTILSNIDFQECIGMEGMNFRGLNLQGARLVGIIDPGLNACDFRDANLRGVQFDFSQIHGSNFTGADLTGSNIRVAEGSNEVVGIPDDHVEERTVDIHKTFKNIRINMLLDFYVEKTGIVDAPLTDSELRSYLLARLRYMIDNRNDTETDKRRLTTGLESCFTQRLYTYNFSQVVAGTDPQIKFNKLIYCAIQYVERQPKEFQDIYVESFIMDSTQAYGENGMSCAAGIVERFITVMEQAAVVAKDTISEKTEEYVELINIITNDPKSLIKNFQQEWFEYHSESGPNAFAESASLDTIMDNYKAFLEERFNYANLRGANREKIKRLIIEDPNAGVNITREYIENSILFFGGRVKDNRHLNYFKMLKDRFYIRDRYKKTTSRTRKHKGRKHKGRKNKKNTNKS